MAFGSSGKNKRIAGRQACIRRHELLWRRSTPWQTPASQRDAVQFPAITFEIDLPKDFEPLRLRDSAVKFPCLLLRQAGSSQLPVRFRF